jgi:FkbM family methyltransferase
MVRTVEALLAISSAIQLTSLRGPDKVLAPSPPNHGCANGKDVCDFLKEDGKPVECWIEHNSRLMYTKWIPPTAHVLEVGARYGQTTCSLAEKLRANGTLTSVEADSRVWKALDDNLAKHKCNFPKLNLIKGVVGPQPKVIVPEPISEYGTHTAPEKSATDKGLLGLVAQPHSVKSLNDTIDTLAIDCEGCFATFLHENPELLDTLRLIVVESHYDQSPAEENEIKRLLASGNWTKVDHRSRQRVLCHKNTTCTVQDAGCV